MLKDLACSTAHIMVLAVLTVKVMEVAASTVACASSPVKTTMVALPLTKIKELFLPGADQKSDILSKPCSITLLHSIPMLVSSMLQRFSSYLYKEFIYYWLNYLLLVEVSPNISSFKSNYI